MLVSQRPGAVPHASGSSLALACKLTIELGQPFLLPAGQQAPVSFWAKSYRQKLQALPAPESFGKVWSAFQTPQGNLLDEVEFDRHGPLLNIYRPRGAKVWSCSDLPLPLQTHPSACCLHLHRLYTAGCSLKPPELAAIHLLLPAAQTQLHGNLCLTNLSDSMHPYSGTPLLS